jgi:hypothetical protein
MCSSTEDDHKFSLVLPQRDIFAGYTGDDGVDVNEVIENHGG